MKAIRKHFFITERFEPNLLIFEQMGLGERKGMIWNQFAEYGEGLGDRCIRTIEMYAHISTKNIQQIKSPFDYL
jgi:hypothetical protein